MSKEYEKTADEAERAKAEARELRARLHGAGGEDEKLRAERDRSRERERLLDEDVRREKAKVAGLQAERESLKEAAETSSKEAMDLAARLKDSVELLNKRDEELNKITINADEARSALELERQERAEERKENAKQLEFIKKEAANLVKSHLEKADEQDLCEAKSMQGTSLHVALKSEFEKA